MKRNFLLVLCFCMGLFLIAPTTVFATPVDLELFLLVDVSGSVDAGEYALQKTGYINAFKDANIQAFIGASPGGIAVSYAEWSGATQQAQLVGWTHITDAASSIAFADAIDGTSRAYSGTTAPGSAINWAVPLFGTNSFDGGRRVIDISGDGQQNTGDNTFDAATNAFAQSIIVNGLAIGGSTLETWYQDNIVTPGGGFLVSVSDFDDFGDAVFAKIAREIQDVNAVPEPTTLLLLGVGLLGMAGLGRKKFFNQG